MADETSLVVKVSSPLVNTGAGKFDVDILYQMFETGLNALSGGNDYHEYFRLLFGNDDVIGIKVNTLGGPGMSTRVEAVEILSGLMSDSGIPKKKHLIWDRHDRELTAVGFTLKTRNGPMCFGTDHTGVGFSKRLVSKGKVGGLLSRILTDYCSGFVNFPVLKDHSLAGITCSLKNHYGSIHNPNKYHDNGCDPYIADLNSLEQIRNQQRLIIVDCLRVQFHGGPAYHSSWAADYGALLMGTDPVAIDAVGNGIVEDLRRNAGMQPLKGSRREPIYIQRSAQYGLGNSDPEKIELRELIV